MLRALSASNETRSLLGGVTLRQAVENEELGLRRTPSFDQATRAGLAGTALRSPTFHGSARGLDCSAGILSIEGAGGNETRLARLRDEGAW